MTRIFSIFGMGSSVTTQRRTIFVPAERGIAARANKATRKSRRVLTTEVRERRGRGGLARCKLIGTVTGRWRIPEGTDPGVSRTTFSLVDVGMVSRFDLVTEFGCNLCPWSARCDCQK